MKKILILASAGMAGKAITKYLNNTNKYKIYTTARDSLYTYPTYELDVCKNLPKLDTIIYNIQPDVIINAIGLLVKACKENIDKAIYLNSYFPHYLEAITNNTKTKIFHLSTDCVFSGKKGNYSETDIPDETSNYGRSKTFGEIINDKDLTIRMSIIGNELKKNGTGLFQWFTKQEGNCRGYTRAYWNGITCLELAKQINKIINTNLTGLYHLAPDFKISKYDLLKLIAKVFNKDIIIEKNDNFIQDKTLVNNRKREYDPKIPSYEIQLQKMKEFIR